MMELVVRTTVVLVVACVIAATLRRATPATRHLLWHITLLPIVAAPMLQPLAPRIALPDVAAASTVTSFAGSSAEGIRLLSPEDQGGLRRDRAEAVSGPRRRLQAPSPPPGFPLARWLPSDRRVVRIRLACRGMDRTSQHARTREHRNRGTTRRARTRSRTHTRRSRDGARVRTAHSWRRASGDPASVGRTRLGCGAAPCHLRARARTRPARGHSVAGARASRLCALLVQPARLDGRARDAARG